jgi:hypothetical protein
MRGDDLSLSAFRGKATPKARLLRSARNDRSNTLVRKGAICHCETVRPLQSQKLWKSPLLRQQLHSLITSNWGVTEISFFDMNEYGNHLVYLFQ